MSVLLGTVVGCTQSNTTPVVNRWDWGPVIPQKKSAFATVAATDRIIAVGGTYWHEDEAHRFTKVYLPTVYQLADNATSWSPLPDYPHPIGYPLVATLGHNLYVIGGHNGQQAIREVRTLAWDASEPRWIAAPSLPLPASRIRGGVMDETIYAVIQQECLPSSPQAEHVDAEPCVLSWQPESDDAHWEKVCTLPKPKIAYRTVAVCGKEIFFFGGGVTRADGSMQLRSNADAYDVEKEKWRELRPLPVALRDASATAIDDRYVLIAGGVEEAASSEATADGTARIILMNICLLYDTMEDVYIRQPALRLAVADHGLVYLDNIIYAVAGEDSPYRTRTDLVQVSNLR